MFYQSQLKKSLILVSLGIILIFVVLSSRSIPLNKSSNKIDPPVNSNNSNESTISTQSWELLSVPAQVFLIKDSHDTFSTKRDRQDVERILQRVNEVWSQGKITTNIRFTGQAEIASKAAVTIDQLPILLRSIPKYNPNAVNIFFVRTLGGSNGIAFDKDNIILIADFTTVNDFRATSHELGHIFGLSHTDEGPERLMYRGVNGTKLENHEVQKARSYIMQSYY